MKIGIIGLGLIGGSIAQGLKKNNHKISAYDKDSNSLKYAIDRNIIDESFENLNDFLKNNTLVYLCLYPHDIISFFKINGHLIQPGTIFIEVSGIKSSLISEIEKIDLPNIEIIYTHPIAGKESSGIYNSDCSIFENSNYIIIDYFKNKKENVALTKKLAEEIGFNKISVVSMEIHDDLLAYTSHITHLISMALVNSYDEEINIIDFAGDSYKDLTRIAQNNSILWTDIFLNNSKYILKRLDLFIEELNLLKKEIQNKDSDKLKILLEKSNKLKKKYKKVR
ncbi:MAG: prephenate dehydrogenase/arogenate dehydrogenase family protein [Tenericutes bacterium HGW-Tenericutes-5]|jgi:prephenate dehydrogenase|nr:MAG: prephenate dehydrogenase/arogenate dehydrogenase family protein [Tenericutes bacterium HGW-Tenericutes-5]